MLIAKANYRFLANLPSVKAGDLKSLETFVGCLNDAMCVLTKSGHSKEVDSTMSMEAVLAKLPACLKDEWGDKIIKMHHDPNLTHLRDWLYWGIMGRSHPNTNHGKWDVLLQCRFPAEGLRPGPSYRIAVHQEKLDSPPRSISDWNGRKNRPIDRSRPTMEASNFGDKEGDSGVTLRLENGIRRDRPRSGQIKVGFPFCPDWPSPGEHRSNAWF